MKEKRLGSWARGSGSSGHVEDRRWRWRTNWLAIIRCHRATMRPILKRASLLLLSAGGLSAPIPGMSRARKRSRLCPKPLCNRSLGPAGIGAAYVRRADEPMISNGPKVLGDRSWLEGEAHAEFTGGNSIRRSKHGAQKRRPARGDLQAHAASAKVIR